MVPRAQFGPALCGPPPVAAGAAAARLATAGPATDGSHRGRAAAAVFHWPAMQPQGLALAYAGSIALTCRSPRPGPDGSRLCPTTQRRAQEEGDRLSGDK